ncbi:MAG: hypothetical protein V3U14_12985 [candidate division NC10 bacterium]
MTDDDQIARVTLEATMARNGLHKNQRTAWYDDNDKRYDPLEDRELIVGLLHDLDALVAAVPGDK